MDILQGISVDQPSGTPPAWPAVFPDTRDDLSSM
jgi:hypothetical protein